MVQNELAHNPHLAHKIHCIGVGGIGVSAIARMFFEQGKNVTGSDVAASDITKELKNLGMKITIGAHKGATVPKDADVVVFSPAVPEDNPERLFARKQGILEVSYPEMIGHIMREYIGIAVSGTHGKTTTTALLGHILTFAKIDPTVIVGSFVNDLDAKNERLGSGKYMVVEADEYKASFLNYKPKIIVLTTIDEDHLDYYRDIQHIIGTFHEYILRMQKDGVVIANADDEHTQTLLAAVPEYDVVTYSRRKDSASVYATDISLSTKGTAFVVHEKEKYFRVETSLMGEHNVSNVLAAYACSRKIGIPAETIISALKIFKGVWRRFDIQGTFSGVTIIDDYAHHPTEVKALIRSLRQSFPDRRIVFVYQPHQDDRFSKLFDKFTSAFDGVDALFLAEIYDVKGRQGEKDTAERLLQYTTKRGVPTSFFKTFSALSKHILSFVQKNDVLIFVGAGNIPDVRKKIQSNLES